MKRFLLYLVVAIAAISFGLTIYYFSADNEVILIRSSYLVVDVGDNIPTNTLLEFKNKNDKTTVSYSSNGGLLSYNANGGYFAAGTSGGRDQIVVNTTNSSYSRLVIDVLVCDGSVEYPYIITNEEDLSRIGRTGEEKYTSDLHYELGANITLTSAQENEPVALDDEVVYGWTPISEFSGTFNGNGYTISNMVINDNTIKGETNIGFIGKLTNTGKLSNFIFDNAKIDVTSGENIGVVVGQNSGEISSIDVRSVVKVEGSDAKKIGGVVGYNLSDSVINYPDFDATLKEELQGEEREAEIERLKEEYAKTVTSTAIVDRCGVEGALNLSSENFVAGGVVGENSGKMSATYFRATGLSVKNFGGVVGTISGEKSALYDSYFYILNDEGIDFTKIGGIVYNISGSESQVYGNYYGGKYAKEQNKEETLKVNPFINGSAVTGDVESLYNGFLDEAEFMNQDKFLTYTYDVMESGEDGIPHVVDTVNKKWFDTNVWFMASSYPVLNFFNSNPTTYVITSIVAGTPIETAEELYRELSTNPNGVLTIVGEKKEYATGTPYFAIDFSGDWKWGDAEHPIPENFNGQIYCTNGCKIRGLTIVLTEDKGDMGLVKKLSKDAVVNGLSFEDINLESVDPAYKAYTAGVLAAVNEGSVLNITINSVQLNVGGVLNTDSSFGVLFGESKNSGDNFITDIKISNVLAGDSYFYYVGGIVGYNATNITCINGYNKVEFVDLYGNYAGGVAGINKGNISKIDAKYIELKKDSNETTITQIYGSTDIGVGGIAGYNQGGISDVYVNAEFSLDSGENYIVSVGGVAGFNKDATIERAYVIDTEITVKKNYRAHIGGIVGWNGEHGLVTNCIVSGGSLLGTVTPSKGYYDTAFSFDTSKIQDSTTIVNVDVCTFTGGIVGYDCSTLGQYSIYECSSQVDTIQGRYAGGLTGSTFGKVYRSFVGSAEKPVKIIGLMAGGLSALVSGKVVDCYTFAELTALGKPSNNISDIIGLKAASSAGLAVIVFSSGEIRGCYTVATFKGEGTSFSTTLDISSKYNEGKITGCVYQNYGANIEKYGSKLESDQLKGLGANEFQTFYKAIGSEDKSVWAFERGNYPKLSGVEDRLPKLMAE